MIGITIQAKRVRTFTTIPYFSLLKLSKFQQWNDAKIAFLICLQTHRGLALAKLAIFYKNTLKKIFFNTVPPILDIKKNPPETIDDFRRIFYEGHTKGCDETPNDRI